MPTVLTLRTIDQSAGGKLRDHNAEESWALLEDLALYDNESWNDPRDFAKPVKAIALSQDVPMNKITTSCEICSGPHDTQYYMEDPEQAFVEYVSSRTDEAGEGLVSEFMASQDASSINAITIHLKQQSDSHDRTEENEKEERGGPENHLNSPTPPDPLISFVTEKVLKFNSLFESLRLVPSSPNAELVCIKEEVGDVMFIEIILKDDNSHREGPEAGV
ncbi:hypothetical protein Tco_0364822 [Tanacetum coccineum]